jgi:hypothetical protein
LLVPTASGFSSRVERTSLRLRDFFRPAICRSARKSRIFLLNLLKSCDNPSSLESFQTIEFVGICIDDRTHIANRFVAAGS